MASPGFRRAVRPYFPFLNRKNQLQFSRKDQILDLTGQYSLPLPFANQGHEQFPNGEPQRSQSEKD
jgi:hypothetical protein